MKFDENQTTTVDILQSFMKFDERNPIFFKSPLFCFHGNCGKVCPTDSDEIQNGVAMETEVPK
jgi:hypothetical protein